MITFSIILILNVMTAFWPLKLVAYLVVNIVGVVFSPLICTFVSKDGYLPKWLIWFQTVDSNMFGADGDVGFRDENAHLLGSWTGRWWVATKWEVRNTANYFRQNVVGFTLQDGGTIDTTTHIGTNRAEFETACAINPGNSFMRFLFSGWIWNVYFVWRWSDTKRFRLNIGWKIQRGPFGMMVFSISPYVNI